ncbi:hypothetical protein KFK09_016701 [Dendrobium nobile]|uniref:Uncharacterized protein n=1 Tax=Dendrobium nobile TaxID=94219 RepID=A0A8T3AYV5_DENNO|nr:hypothetical protein KFK09_016701 [Dendrobium nobile]
MVQLLDRIRRQGPHAGSSCGINQSPILDRVLDGWQRSAGRSEFTEDPEADWTSLDAGLGPAGSGVTGG